MYMCMLNYKYLFFYIFCSLMNFIVNCNNLINLVNDINYVC